MHPFEIAAFDFRFRVREAMRMPDYMGSAWRDGFGHALRRAACITGLSTCPGCPFEASGVYQAGRLVGPTALRPRHLLLSLLRRISSLAERHGPAPLDLDYRAFKMRAETAEFAASELRRVEWARWCGRRQTLLQMGGLLGSLLRPFVGLEPFWPFVALAPWVHVGESATMWLGALRIIPS
jgi:hypothetical protein